MSRPRKQKEPVLSGYRIVWVIVLFDLPVKEPEERHEYTQFRKALLKDGFDMMQYSVYMRHCPSEENAAVHIGRVRHALPPEGQVRIMKITDKQFGRMDVFWGKLRKKAEQASTQLVLF